MYERMRRPGSDLRSPPAPLLCSGIFQFSVLESSPTGTPVGRIRATDEDTGLNAEMFFTIASGDGMDVFLISTDPATQEGVITVAKVRERPRSSATTPRQPSLLDLYLLILNSQLWLTTKVILCNAVLLCFKIVSNAKEEKCFSSGSLYRNRRMTGCLICKFKQTMCISPSSHYPSGNEDHLL